MSNQSLETLTFSEDKKFLLDSTGKKVKQYLESAGAFVPMSVKDKDGIEIDVASLIEKGEIGKGREYYPCNCRNECIAWYQGKCTQTYNTCDICWKTT